MMQGAITKRMTAIEEMAGMDVLCSDKTGTLTLNKLTVDKNLIEVGHSLDPYLEKSPSGTRHNTFLAFSDYTKYISLPPSHIWTC